MEQNFDDDLISESIPVAQVTHRLQTLSPSPRPNLDFKRLLYTNSKSNKKSHKGRTLSIIESSAKHEREKEEKIQEMKKMEQTNRMKECTFKPSVNQSKSKKRTLKEFLEFQESFINRAQNNRQTLHKKMKENDPTYTFQPKINSKKKGTSDIPTYERLYNISKHALTEREITEPDFIPAITSRGKEIVRNTPFHEHLYVDALRRQRQQIRREEQSYSPQPGKPNRDKKDRLVAQKVIKQYYGWLNELNIESRLCFEEFVLVLYRMGFVSSNLDENEGISFKEKKLLLEAYQTLKLPTVRNACVFILAVIGVYNINPINFTPQESTSQVFELNFNQQTGRKVQTTFDTLFRNRLYNESSKLHSITDSEYSFKPTISSRSEALASIHRSRMLEQTSMMLESTEMEFPKQGTIIISHADLLHLNKLGKEVSNLKKKEQKELEELQECSFQPNLTSVQKLGSSGVGVRKCEQLYQRSRLVVKQERSVIDREYQENEKECTFKPAIHKAPQRMDTDEEPAPNFTKTVARLFQGRRLKQQKHIRVPTENTSTNTITPIRTNSSRTPTLPQPLKRTSTPSKYEQPFLVIDVNLGNTVQQISISKNQLQDGKRLAQQFAEKHRLDNGSRQKLIKMLGMEIFNILNEIEEEDENYWSDDS